MLNKILIELVYCWNEKIWLKKCWMCDFSERRENSKPNGLVAVLHREVVSLETERGGAPTRMTSLGERCPRHWAVCASECNPAERFLCLTTTNSLHWEKTQISAASRGQLREEGKNEWRLCRLQRGAAGRHASVACPLDYKRGRGRAANNLRLQKISHSKVYLSATEYACEKPYSKRIQGLFGLRENDAQPFFFFNDLSLFNKQFFFLLHFFFVLSFFHVKNVRDWIKKLSNALFILLESRCIIWISAINRDLANVSVMRKVWF